MMFRNSYRDLFSISAVFILLMIVSCSKDKSSNPAAPRTPTVTTAGVTDITQSTATCGGTVTSDGGAAVFYRGVCWRTDSLPTYADTRTYDSTGIGTFSSLMTELVPSTKYYVRAYAMNDIGLGYGAADSFVTTQDTISGSVTDIDGNIYATIRIGTQWWMAENLRVNHYRNGDLIPAISDSVAWAADTTGASCEFNNDTSMVAVYGKLYNWYAINNSSNIAPAGWHVPTDAEWQTLVTYLGGYTVAGGKMKEVGTAHWNSPNTGATNESGFTALPAGFRYINGVFYQMGGYAFFWSSTEANSSAAWDHYVVSAGAEASGSFDLKRHGFSVRCIKD